jgi:hypothetical protein
MIRLALLLTLLALPAYAAERGFSAYDGDTFRATFRIANIDAPEIQGQCDSERKLAIQARDFTRAWLAKGKAIIRQDPKRGVDPYGRILVISNGTARIWEKRLYRGAWRGDGMESDEVGAVDLWSV